MGEEATRRWPNWVYNYGGLSCLAVGVVGAFAVGKSLTATPDVSLVGVWKRFHCDFPSERPLAALEMFAAKSNWLATLVLEGVVAVFAVLLSVGTLVAVARRGRARSDEGLLLILLVGLLAVAWDVNDIWNMQGPGPVRAFLSQLLASLPETCRDVRSSVVFARMLGEPSGVALGVAMTATVNFTEPPLPAELALRSRLLKRLLYIASILFVVGVMMSRVNFTWVLAHWDIAGDKVAKAVGAVAAAGVVQSGVGYSALLLAFFAPVRGLLSLHMAKAVPAAKRTPEKTREEWLKENDLSGRWQDDVRQILAILAPVLSAPVFDAIAKL